MFIQSYKSRNRSDGIVMRGVIEWRDEQDAIFRLVKVWEFVRGVIEVRAVHPCRFSVCIYVGIPSMD